MANFLLYFRSVARAFRPLLRIAFVSACAPAKPSLLWKSWFESVGLDCACVDFAHSMEMMSAMLRPLYSGKVPTKSLLTNLCQAGVNCLNVLLILAFSCPAASS